MHLIGTDIGNICHLFARSFRAHGTQYWYRSAANLMIPVQANESLFAGMDLDKCWDARRCAHCMLARWDIDREKCPSLYFGSEDTIASDRNP